MLRRRFRSPEASNHVTWLLNNISTTRFKFNASCYLTQVATFVARSVRLCLWCVTGAQTDSLRYEISAINGPFSIKNDGTCPKSCKWQLALPITEKPSFWFTFAQLQVNWPDFRQSRVSTSEKTRFLCSVRQRQRLGLYIAMSCSGCFTSPSRLHL